MDDFMKHIAPEIWPKGKRTGLINKIIQNKNMLFILLTIAFCYAFRNGNDCAAKEGNPFGPYWDKFGISIY